MVVGMGEVGKEFFWHQVVISRCRSICDVIFVSLLVLKKLTQKSGFSTGEILRKYVRYALNEKLFNPQLVQSSWMRRDMLKRA
ncbi:hypothetical protein Hanom_Chr02g00170981 [Helianthus anomalus]